MKKLTGDAPLYLLGPLVTDIAPGYDHVVGAIGGSLAGMAGADFLCIVTPSEHLALPTAEDIKEGVVVGRIAAHVADTVKEGQRERSREHDHKMSRAREDLDWEEQLRLSVDPKKAGQIRSTRLTEGDTCSMCSDLCAIKLVKEALRQDRP
jgi:phosphomethylpyrimidine synthase